MTLIKKIKQVHAGATTTNLVAMALMMSAIGCGCGDDDKDSSNDKAVEINIDAPDPTPVKGATDTTIDVKITVKEGTLKPTEWKINMKDVKVFKHDNAENKTHAIKWDQDGKTLKEASVDELKKEATGSFKLKVTPAKAFAGDGDVAKITASLEIEGKIKNSKGVEEPKTFKKPIVITAGS